MINLVGPAAQQDTELAGLYNDAVQTYGEGKVLGILAAKNSEHELRKRAIEEENQEKKDKIEENPAVQTERPEVGKPAGTEDTNCPAANETAIDYIFYGDMAVFKILLHTRSAPRIIEDGKESCLTLNSTTVTVARRNQNNVTAYVLNVRYNNKEKVRSE